MQKRRTPLVFLASAALIGVATTGIVFAQNAGSGGEASRIACPDVGPSGQVGEMTCNEAPAGAGDGESPSFGPYRLLPPGTKFIERDYGPAPQPGDFEEVDNEAVVREWHTYTAPVEGATEESLTGRLLRGEPLQIFSTWRIDGHPVTVIVTDYPGSFLPLDVYLHPDDSRVAVKPEQIGGRFAVVEEPASGPAANVGYVSLWMGGYEVAFRSSELDHAALRQLAEAVAARTQ